MAKSRQIPAYQLHKATGQARVRIHGKEHWLGKHGSAESHSRYDRLIEDVVLGRLDQITAKSLNSILAAWWPECKRRYGGRGKGPYGHAVSWRPVIRLLPGGVR